MPDRLSSVVEVSPGTAVGALPSSLTVLRVFLRVGSSCLDLVLLGRWASPSCVAATSAIGSYVSTSTSPWFAVSALLLIASFSGGGEIGATDRDESVPACAGTRSLSVSSAEAREVGVSLRFPGTRSTGFSASLDRESLWERRLEEYIFARADRVLTGEIKDPDESRVASSLADGGLGSAS